MAFEISRTSPIGELVMNYPAAASVLLEHGFHCIGCGLAAYETIEEGAAAHGFGEAEIDALVKEIQDAARKEEDFLNLAAEKSKAAAQKGEEAEKKPAIAGKVAAAEAKKPADAAKKPAAKNSQKTGKKKPKPG
ncbi:MAG: DUF1858 domain-containing protein [Candidatus Micrarchaeota archaeon]|nr:DUF1858 domain-containing protein [Candidatus Micrarchaeota archaeon]